MTHIRATSSGAQRIIRAASAIAIWLSLTASAQRNIEAQETPAMQRMDAHIAIPPLPQDAANQYAKLNTVLQPSLKSWVEDQARAELKRPNPDIASLEASIRARYHVAGSTAARLSPTPAYAPNAPAGSGHASAATIPAQSGMGAMGVPADGDIAAVAFIVMMQATNDQDQDLKQIMDQVQAMTRAKDALRNTMNSLQSELASAANQQAAAPCTTPGCQSIGQQLGQVESLISQTKHSVHFNVSRKPTYGQLRQAQAALNDSSTTLSDMSQSMQMKMQMEMDRRTKFLEALSNIEKKMSDTSSSILQNMK